MAKQVRAKVNQEYDTVFRSAGDLFYLVKNEDFNKKAMEWASQPISKELQKELTPQIPQAGRPKAVADEGTEEVPALPATGPVAPPAAAGEKKGTGDQILI